MSGPKRPSKTTRIHNKSTQDNFLYDEPTGGFKKRRLGRACDFCRMKRIRCDSVKMPGHVCSNCITYNVECTHRGTMNKEEYSPISKQSLVEEILSTNQFCVPDDKEVVQKMITDLATYARTLENRISTLVKTLSSMNAQVLDAVVSSEDNEGDEAVSLLSSFMSDVSIKEDMDKKKGRFLGNSSMMALLKSTWHMQRNQGRSPEEEPLTDDDDFSDTETLTATPEWSKVYPVMKSRMEYSPDFDFPSRDLILSLSDTYFRYLAITIPFMHRPSFERNIAEGLHLRDRQFGALVLSVCACGARGSSDPRVYSDDPEKNAKAGLEWHKQIEPMRGRKTLKPLTLYELQMIINYMFFVPLWLPNWTMLCHTIRVAQELGIHRKRWYTQTHLSAAEKELWKRAFWLLFATDIHLSDYLGRPGLMVPEDYDLDLPLICDDEYWPGEQPGSGIAFQQPKGKPSIMAHWISRLKLLTIFKYGQRTIYAARRPQFITGADQNWRQKVVAQIDSALNSWVEEVPAHLRWNSHSILGGSSEQSSDLQRIFATQTTALYSMYYFIQIQIHRPFITKAAVDASIHLSICVNAARSCVHLLDVYSQKYKTPPIPHIYVRLFSAALVLILNISSGQLTGLTRNSTTDKEYIKKCIEILQRFEGKWQVTRRCSDIIQNLVDRCLNFRIRSTQASVVPSQDSSMSTETVLPSHLPSVHTSITSPGHSDITMSIADQVDAPSSSVPFQMSNALSSFGDGSSWSFGDSASISNSHGSTAVMPEFAQSSSSQIEEQDLPSYLGLDQSHFGAQDTSAAFQFQQSFETDLLYEMMCDPNIFNFSQDQNVASNSSQNMQNDDALWNEWNDFYSQGTS